MENLTQHAKKSFNRLGWALIAAGGIMLLISLLSSIMLVVDHLTDFPLTQGFFDFLYQHALTYWVLYVLPFFLIALPLAAFIIRKLPGTPVEKNRFSGKSLLAFGLVALALETPVNFLTVLFTDFIYRDLHVPVLADAQGVSFLVLLDLVVLAPVFEEFLFRKVLLDHFRRYGEVLAILVSAVSFALLHMNFQQIPVNIVLGVVLAYVYLRSGSLWCCAALHAASNFLANGMISILLTRLSPKAWMLLQTRDENFLAPDILTELYPLAAYLIFFLCLVVAGWVILFRNRKKIKFQPTEDQLAPKQAAAAVFGAPGIFLYLVITLFSAVTQLIYPLI